MKAPKKIRATKKLNAFVDEVASTLASGDRHKTAGFGTFSTCTRKAAPGRPACTMAMFRASAELRAYADGASAPVVSGPHADVIGAIIVAMNSEQGVEVPALGRMAVVASGKKSKLIFHAAEVLNAELS